MNASLRRVMGVLMVMFLALMVATTWVQFGVGGSTLYADSLNEDSRNPRTIYNEYGNARGPILVADKAVASSKEVDDAFGYQRTYANGPLYAPVTGFYSIASGRTETEDKENSYLNGQASSLWLSRLTATLTGKEAQGSSVELTIDPAVQKAAYDALGDQRGAVVAIEPKTGRVLALVSKPSYDPNLLAVHDTAKASAAYKSLDAAEGSPLQNRAIRGNTYPPGSTFKLVTSAAAIESGTYTSQSQIDAPDSYLLPGTRTTMRNFGNERCSPTGRMTMEAALEMSCNSAFAGLGNALGDDALRAQSEKFGFNTSLSIPLTVTKSYYPTEQQDAAQTALAAIGQGNVRVTPLQVAMISAAIANDGVEMSPYVVETIRGSDLRTVSSTKPKELRRSVSSQTAGQLREMMIGVVQNGTGKPAQIPGVSVAGKTGTAESAKGTAPHAWFTGFAPAGDPQVAVAVIVEHGGSLGNEATGGAVAAPIAKAVMKAVIDK